MMLRAFAAATALTIFALPLQAQEATPADASADRAEVIHEILVKGLDHARLTLICSADDAARQTEIKAIWKDVVMDILMALDEAEVKPKVLPAIAASRDSGTLAIRDGEDPAEWQSRCAAETTWQGAEALDALKALPQAVKDAL